MNKNYKYTDHYPVLLNEVLEALVIENSGEYLDCTFGAGGYSSAILSAANCKLTALDQDPNVKKYVDPLQEQFKERFNFMQMNFSEAYRNLSDQKFDGIVLDLGVSSMQIDQRERGFSFQEDGDLDMRMSCEGESAAEFINNASEQEIADIIFKYGDEKESRRIARSIVAEREKKEIVSTLQLADIIRSAKRMKKSKIDLATKSFQAIRIHVNQELAALERFLDQVKDMLKIGGRLVIVSFHSLEDSIVKQFFKENSLKQVARSKYADKYSKITLEKQPGKWLKLVAKKAIVPSQQELDENIRSRSAKMRIAERIAEDNTTDNLVIDKG